MQVFPAPVSQTMGDVLFTSVLDNSYFKLKPIWGGKLPRNNQMRLLCRIHHPVENEFFINANEYRPSVSFVSTLSSSQATHPARWQSGVRSQLES